MIGTLEIKNFKSIKQLKLDCKRINILIGEPNTGKSNILEALGLFSFGHYCFFGNPLKAFVRFERMTNLFHDEILNEEIEIKCDRKALNLRFDNGHFRGGIRQDGSNFADFTGDYNNLGYGAGPSKELSPFKFYRFAIKDGFGRPESDFLLPPSGDNLLSVLLHHKELRSTANALFSHFGFRLGLRPQEGKIEVIRQLEDVIVSYPYSLASDTLQRLVFYLTAILSNKESILVFEEPEAHAFPFYTKHLAETIALDDRKNQFFMSTHNPYLLLPLLEKSPKEDVAIFIVHFKDYQTKAKLLSEKEMQESLDIDIFANLDRFVE